MKKYIFFMLFAMMTFAASSQTESSQGLDRKETIPKDHSGASEAGEYLGNDASIIIAQLETPAATTTEPGQSAIEIPEPITAEGGVEVVIKWFDALYMALLIIIGFLAPKIPFLNRLKHREYVLLSAALVSAMVFWAVGLNVSGVTLVAAFLMQTGVYQYIFKFGAGIKSPKMPLPAELGK